MDSSTGPLAALSTCRRVLPSAVGKLDFGGAGRLATLPGGVAVESRVSESPPQPASSATASRASSAGARRGARIGGMVWRDRVPGVLDERGLGWLSGLHW